MSSVFQSPAVVGDEVSAGGALPDGSENHLESDTQIIDESTVQKPSFVQSGVFLVPATLLLLVFLAFIGFKVHMNRKRLQPKAANKRGLSNAPLDGYFRTTAMIPPDTYMQGDLESGNHCYQNDYKETDSLLSAANGGDRFEKRNTHDKQNSAFKEMRGHADRSTVISNLIDDAITPPRTRGAGKEKVTPPHAQPAAPAAHHSSPITPSTALVNSMRDTSNDGKASFTEFQSIDAILTKFTKVMGGEGLALSLHTTKGPKPVLFSFIDGEVRWQAAKGANKRYKLGLGDITTVESGKKTSNFLTVGGAADDSLCFSILTSRTTLDLEASSSSDRDSLVMGFRTALKNYNKERII